jgi:hypothetical protein
MTITLRSKQATDFEAIRKKTIAAAFVLRSKQDKVSNLLSRF